MYAVMIVYCVSLQPMVVAWLHRVFDPDSNLETDEQCHHTGLQSHGLMCQEVVSCSV